MTSLLHQTIQNKGEEIRDARRFFCFLEGTDTRRLSYCFPKNKDSIILEEIRDTRRLSKRRRIDVPKLLDDDGGVGELPPGPVAPVHLLQLGCRAILAAALRHGRGSVPKVGHRNVQRGGRQHRLHLHCFEDQDRAKQLPFLLYKLEGQGKGKQDRGWQQSREGGREGVCRQQWSW